MDSYNDKVEGMKWGFRINEFMSIFAVFFVIAMLIIVKKARKNEKTVKKHELFEEIDTDV